ncbi:MAG: 16S rRNA (guanine(527)-N(7))-methyltransferase RsmG [Eubacteriaceae bacterium]|nr:16S rRNA (guanine(527)-N(7))-methyltransferase RsmG [Eubacteriaceae bacterium]
MDNVQKRELLLGGAESLGIMLHPSEADGLLFYMEKVLKKNKVMNLTAIRDEERFIYLNLLDCLSVLRVLPECASVIDVGTGAGLPGMVIALMRRDTEVTLMDATAKKLSFLDELVGEMGLGNVTTLCGRAEELSRDTKYRDNFDSAVSRAVARLPLLMEYSLPFVKKGGVFVAMKGAEAGTELAEAEDLTDKLGSRLSGNDSFILPGGEEKRSLLVFEKVRDTDKAYPRRNSVLKKLYSK